jgi:glutathione S-transferase
MIKLCGFAVSNYYNKVKLALLEKDIPFEEVLVWTDRSPDLLRKSPLGKVPYIETEQGALCESQVILDYLEQAYPENLVAGRCVCSGKSQGADRFYGAASGAARTRIVSTGIFWRTGF